MSFYIVQAKAQTYTLTDDDVVVLNGVIQTCSYDFSNKDITIPSTLDGQTIVGLAGSWPTSVFEEKGLTSVALPATLKTIGSSVFANNNLNEIILPSSLEVVGTEAFKQNQLTTLTIPQSVQIIGASAFAGNNLTGATFEASSNLDIIHGLAFDENTGLTGITMPTHAHSDFVSYLNGAEQAIYSGQTLTDFSQSVFAHIPYTLTDDDVVVSSGAIRSCNYDFEQKSVIIPQTLDGQTVTAIASIGGLEGLTKGIFSQKGLRYIQLPESLTSMGRLAFSGNALLFVDLPNALTSIGQSAFYNNQLQSIELPPNLKNLAHGTFGTNAIKNASLPAGIEVIGTQAFYNNRLESISIPTSIVTIEKNAFFNNQLSQVTFAANSSIRTVEEGAFANNTDLIQVALPTHKESNLSSYFDSNNQPYQPGDFISDFSAYYRANITYTLTDNDVVIDDGVLVSCSYDFSGNSIIIPEILDGQQVTAIGRDTNSVGVFQTKGLVAIALPDGLKSIGKQAFHDNSISAVNLPNGLETIGQSAFGYNQIKIVTIPSSIKKINYHAYVYNALTTVVFQPNSNIQTIEGHAFTNNRDLTSFTLPTNVTSGFTEYIDAFGTVFEPGDRVTRKDHAVYTKIPYTLTDDDVVVTDGVIRSCNYDFESKHIIIPDRLDGQSVVGLVGQYSSGMFSRKDIISLELPQTLKWIGHGTFSYNKIARVNFPQSIESIGTVAFYKNPLNKVVFEGETNILRIGSSAFTHSILTARVNLTLPQHAHLDFIDYSDALGNKFNVDETFQYNNSELFARVPYQLTDQDVEVVDHTIISSNYNTDYKVIVIPDMLDGQEIHGLGASLFFGHGLDSVRLPSLLKSIGKSTFWKNYLHSVDLPSQLETIGSQAFSTNNLKAIDIPSSIHTIDEGAFISNQLSEVNLSALGFLGAHAFASNTALTTVQLPVNSDADFINYGDSDLNRYQPGETFSDFSRSYYARIPYTLSDDDVEVVRDTLVSTSFDYRHKVILIPDILDNQTVRAIADDTYSGYIFRNKGIDSLSLPNSLKSIGASVFQDNNLESITLPDELTTIRYKAFYGNHLTEIIIPKSIEYLGTNLFDRNNLSSAEFEANSQLFFMDYNALKSNGTLTSINLPIHADGGFLDYRDSQDKLYEEGDVFEISGKQLFTRISYTLTDDDVVVENDTLKTCNLDKRHNVILIPDVLDGQSIVAISDNNSLVGSPNFVRHELDSIRLPAGLKYIGKGAFYGNKLRYITLPIGVAVINDQAFMYNNITELYFPNSIETIGTSAFHYNLLKTADFEQNSHLVEIGENAFLSNYSLTPPTLPTNAHPDFIAYADGYGYKYKEGDIFNRLYTSLTLQIPYTLTDPDVITENGMIISCSYSFKSKYVIIPDTLDNQYVTGIAGANDRYSTAPFKWQGLDSLRLPSGLKFIGPFAFANNNLEQLILPDSLKTIKEGAFSLNQLRSVVLPEMIEEIGEKAFEYNSLIYLVFKENSKIEEIGRRAFYNNPNLASFIFPSHSDPEFYKYVDNYGFSYKPGDEVNQFDRSFETRLTPYPLIIEIEGEGYPNPGVGKHEYSKGQHVNLTAYPALHWEFEKWVVNDMEYDDANIEIIIEEENTAKAYFFSILSINEQVEKFDEIFDAYPVPIKDQLYISILEKPGLYSIFLFSIEGQLLQRYKTRITDVKSFDFSDLTSGIYTLKVMNEEGQWSIKRIVKD